MPIQKNRFARSLAIKVIGLSRCIGLSRRTEPDRRLLEIDHERYFRFIHSPKPLFSTPRRCAPFSLHQTRLAPRPKCPFRPRPRPSPKSTTTYRAACRRPDDGPAPCPHAPKSTLVSVSRFPACGMPESAPLTSHTLPPRASRGKIKPRLSRIIHIKDAIRLRRN
jgi:hypothetical protein